jgi:hypothetical protein
LTGGRRVTSWRPPGTPRPLRISSRGAAALPSVARATLGLLLAILATREARADIVPLLGPNGRLLCAGRSGARTVVAALPDGDGSVVLTRDARLDPQAPPDAGLDVGILRLDAGLLPRRVNDAPGGDDPCGTLLLGGTGEQRIRAAIALSPGRYLIAGDENPPDPDQPSRIFAFAFDASAAPLWSDVLLAPADPSSPSMAAFAAPDGAGGFFLGWQESTDPEGLSGRVVIDRFDGEGVAAWASPVVLSSTSGASARDTQIAPDGTGGVFVVWIEWRETGAFPALLLQHLDRSGARLFASPGVPLDPGLATGPPVTLVAGPRGLLVLSLSDRPRARSFTPDGAPVSDAGGVPLTPADAIARSDLHAVAAAGSTYVTWMESPPAGGRRVIISRLLPDGSPAWPSPRVLLERPDLIARTEAILGDGGVIAAATVPASGSGDSTDLVLQAIDPRGRIRTGPAGAPLATVPGTQSHPLFVPTAPDVGSPGAAAPALGVLWSDSRPGTGVSGADAWFTQSLRVLSAPHLDPPTPAPKLRQGEERTMTLAGEDLQHGLTADAGPGIDAQVVAVGPRSANGPGDFLIVRLTARDDAAIGPRVLRIGNPDGGTATPAAIAIVTLDTGRLDIDRSGRADGRDLALLARAFGRARDDPGYDGTADFDGSGLVDGIDLALLSEWFGSLLPRAARLPSGTARGEDEVVDAFRFPRDGRRVPAPRFDERERDDAGGLLEDRRAHQHERP